MSPPERAALTPPHRDLGDWTDAEVCAYYLALVDAIEHRLGRRLAGGTGHLTYPGRTWDEELDGPRDPLRPLPELQRRR